MKIRPLGAELFRADRQTEHIAGRTDMTTEVAAFSNFVNASKN